MTDQYGLRTLIEKYRQDIESRKKELEEKEKKINAMLETLSILEQEGIDTSGNLFSPPVPKPIVSAKYAGKTLSDSIVDIIQSRHGVAIGSKEIYNDLMAGGYKSKSKDKLRDVLVGLNRLEKEKGLIVHYKQGNNNKYTLKEVETMKPEKEGE